MVSKRIVVASLGVFGIAGLVCADGTVDFFTDPGLFEAALSAAGKVSKAVIMCGEGSLPGFLM